MRLFVIVVSKTLFITALLMLLTSMAFPGTINANYNENITPEQVDILNEIIEYWGARTSCDMNLTIDFSWDDLSGKLPDLSETRPPGEYVIAKTPSGRDITAGLTDLCQPDVNFFPEYARIRFNTDPFFKWHFGEDWPPNDEFDFRSVAQHEIYHAIGFSDYYYFRFKIHTSDELTGTRTFSGCADGTEVIITERSMGTHLDPETYGDYMFMSPKLKPGYAYRPAPFHEYILNCAYPCLSGDYYVLAIDCSGSMFGGDDPETGTRFDRAITWALDDVNDIIFADNNDLVRAAIVVFGSAFTPDPFVWQHLTALDESVREKIENLYTLFPDLSGGTPLAEAMSDAADILYRLTQELPYSIGAEQLHLYVYTDGHENQSIHDDESPVIGACGEYLDGNPIGDESNWQYDCNPSDCSDPPEYQSTTCRQYQCCMAEKLKRNNITFARYFGETVEKNGNEVTNRSETTLLRASKETGERNNSISVEGVRNGYMYDYYFLKYIAEASGGSMVYICDDNVPPEITCPANTSMYCGSTYIGTASAIDPDYDPSLTFSLGGGAPANMIIDPQSGEIQWPTSDADEGEHIVMVIVTDLCGAADTCLTHIILKPTPSVIIEKTHNALQGHYEQVSITIEGGKLDMGGFDFLIAYDASALAFIEAKPGPLLEDCGWEYFTYRYGVDGNCGDACPSGLLRIIALAETNDGSNHPSCYGPPDTDPHELVEMTFFVTNDRTFDCQYVPIRFFWMECSDNSVSSVTGDTLFVSDHVYELDGTDITDSTFGFPTYFGIQLGCLEGGGPDKPAPISLIDFINGGVDIICSDSIDARGDINCNGTANEIADVVMFANYFIEGLAAFNGHVEASIAASDINNDGITLTIADFVYLIRILTGDAEAIPKPLTVVNEVMVSTLVNHSAVGVSATSPVDIGAGYFVFEHSGLEIGQPHLINGASDMTLLSRDSDGVLKILVYSMEPGMKISAGTESIFAIPVSRDGQIKLVETQLSDYYGNLLEVDIEKQAILPQKHALHQNYPNPFNAATTIFYELPVASPVKIEVFNVLGQRIATLLDQPEEAGIHSVQWNGTDESGRTASSGVYFYRITAETFTDEKKMLLMK